MSGKGDEEFEDYDCLEDEGEPEHADEGAAVVSCCCYYGLGG